MEMGKEHGAGPNELVIEAARRDNTELLHQVMTGIGSPSKVMNLLNHSRDPLGNTALHVAASSGSYEVLDILLDQEGLEVDPLDKREGETPLHKSVRYNNELEMQHKIAGRAITEILLDAGADPRIRNRAKNKAIDLVDPRDKDLRLLLQKAEYKLNAGGDLVDEDADEAAIPIR